MRTLYSFYIAIATVSVLGAGCKRREDPAIPNLTPHNPGSKSDPAETKQESIAEPLSTDLDDATIDSPSVVSEATDDRDHLQLFGSESDTTDVRQESIAEPLSTDLDDATIDSPSVVSEATDDRDHLQLSGSRSNTTEKTDELLFRIENCIQELGNPAHLSGSESDTTERTDVLLLMIDNLPQELQEVKQRLEAGKYEEK